MNKKYCARCWKKRNVTETRIDEMVDRRLLLKFELGSSPLILNSLELGETKIHRHREAKKCTKFSHCRWRWNFKKNYSRNRRRRRKRKRTKRCEEKLNYWIVQGHILMKMKKKTLTKSKKKKSIALLSVMIAFLPYLGYAKYKNYKV